jgi:hypothetical protein
MSENPTYFSGWEAQYQTCTKCGWRGMGAEAGREVFTGLIQVDCPACDGRLFTVALPTPEQVDQAAAQQQPQAVSMQRAAQERQAYNQRRSTTILQDPASLPDIDGDELDFRLTLLDGEAGDVWLLLTTRDGQDDGKRIGTLDDLRVLHAELAMFEETEPAGRISRVLEQRYGQRYRHLYTHRALLYLGGDNTSARSSIARALGRHAPPRTYGVIGVES